MKVCMWPEWVSNLRPMALESDALLTTLYGPAILVGFQPLLVHAVAVKFNQNHLVLETNVTNL